MRSRSAGEPRWELHRSASCEARMDLGPGAMLTIELSGRVDEEIAEILAARITALGTRHGDLVAFHDWSAAEGCDPGARASLERLLSGPSPIAEAYVLVGPSLLGMGPAVKAALGGRRVRSYLDRESWERARGERARPSRREG